MTHQTITPTRPRVAMLSPEEALARGRELGIDDYIAGMHLFRVLLVHPPLARALNATLMTLVGPDRVLPDRLREIIIMRVSWLAGCDYEWTQHWQAALYFGLPPEELLAVQDWRAAPCFSPAERAALGAVDQWVEQGRVSPAGWAALAEHFADARAQLELLGCIANWHQFAQLINSLDIPLEPGLASWPPEGRGPDA